MTNSNGRNEKEGERTSDASEASNAEKKLLPAHQKQAELFESLLKQRFCQRICEL
jgi:hypothetical protein